MSTVTTKLSELPTVTKTRWRIDPARSSIEFRTPTLWGLATVKGRFDRYEGTLDLDQDPAIELTIDAGSSHEEQAARQAPAFRGLLRRRAQPRDQVRVQQRND